MLAWAGRGVAVANAHAEVLAIADEVTASNDDDGVAIVLERLAVLSRRASLALLVLGGALPSRRLSSRRRTRLRRVAGLARVRARRRPAARRRDGRPRRRLRGGRRARVARTRRHGRAARRPAADRSGRHRRAEPRHGSRLHDARAAPCGPTPRRSGRAFSLRRGLHGERRVAPASRLEPHESDRAATRARDRCDVRGAARAAWAVAVAVTIAFVLVAFRHELSGRARTEPDDTSFRPRAGTAGIVVAVVLVLVLAESGSARARARRRRRAARAAAARACARRRESCAAARRARHRRRARRARTERRMDLDPPRPRRALGDRGHRGRRVAAREQPPRRCDAVGALCPRIRARSCSASTSARTSR